MKEHPILFSAPMVRALLAETKTQTRRVAKPTPEWVEKSGVLSLKGRVGLPHVLCPYGQPGNRLWVRETWQHLDNVGQRAHEFLPHQKHSRHCFFLADESDSTTKPLSGRWRPSIHMPRWASRITLEIVSVRVERLQDISADDARAEGCPDKPVPGAQQASIDVLAKLWFHDLWAQINGQASWDSNPWVWVVEFKQAMGVPA